MNDYHSIIKVKWIVTTKFHVFRANNHNFPWVFGNRKVAMGSHEYVLSFKMIADMGLGNFIINIWYFPSINNLGFLNITNENWVFQYELGFSILPMRIGIYYPHLYPTYIFYKNFGSTSAALIWSLFLSLSPFISCQITHFGSTSHWAQVSLSLSLSPFISCQITHFFSPYFYLFFFHWRV